MLQSCNIDQCWVVCENWRMSLPDGEKRKKTRPAIPPPQTRRERWVWTSALSAGRQWLCRDGASNVNLNLSWVCSDRRSQSRYSGILPIRHRQRQRVKPHSKAHEWSKTNNAPQVHKKIKNRFPDEVRATMCPVKKVTLRTSIHIFEAVLFHSEVGEIQWHTTIALGSFFAGTKAFVCCSVLPCPCISS